MPQPAVKNPFRINSISSLNAENASKQNFTYSRSYRPIYIVSRVLGLMPFSIVIDSSGVILRPAVYTLDALWFLISTIVYICIMYFSFEYFYSEDNFKPISAISLVGNSCIYGINLILCLLAIVFDMLFRFKFVDVFKKFDTFDKEASSNVLNTSKSEIKTHSSNCRRNALEFKLIVSKNADELSYFMQQPVLP